ncbi:hypothetical protein GPECTOR_4g538 [Gonium pectorale]|uniref:Uncharacterized protein n=1 Tax=Gonium pectorale TaxID=33097 RepID=A0A150GXJ6_GONPE|nr:hypothetical protein GPECTOR_4g538 [Gonium pectorale]|eukprot:KXZ54473.1 hypothetical protein GPECTOR_4g538 [Gonium pectorale]
MEDTRESKLAVASTRMDTIPAELWKQYLTYLTLNARLAAVRDATPSAPTYEKKVREQLGNALTNYEKLAMEEILSERSERSKQPDYALRSNQAGGWKKTVGDLKVELGSPHQELHGLKVAGVMEGGELQDEVIRLQPQVKATGQVLKFICDTAALQTKLQEKKSKVDLLKTLLEGVNAAADRAGDVEAAAAAQAVSEVARMGAELAVRNDYARRFGPCAQSPALAVASTRMDTAELPELCDQPRPIIKKPWEEILSERSERSKQPDYALRSNQAGGWKKTVGDLKVELGSPHQELHGLKVAGVMEGGELQDEVIRLQPQVKATGQILSERSERSKQPDYALRSNQAGGWKKTVGDLKVELGSPHQELHGLKVAGVMEGGELQDEVIRLQAQVKATGQVTERFKVICDTAALQTELQKKKFKLDVLKVSLEGVNAAADQARAAGDVEAAAEAQAVVGKQACEVKQLQSEVARMGAELAVRNDYARRFGPCAQSPALAVASTRMDTAELPELCDQPRPIIKKPWEEILSEHSRQRDNALRSKQAGWRKNTIGDLKAEPDSPRKRLHGLKVAGKEEANELQRKMMWLEAQAKATRQTTECVEKRIRTVAAFRKAFREPKEKNKELASKLAAEADAKPSAQTRPVYIRELRMRELNSTVRSITTKPRKEVLPEHSRQRDNALRSNQAGGRKETMADLLEVELDTPRQRLHGLKVAGKGEANELQGKLIQLEAQSDTLTKARSELTHKLVHALEETLREKEAEVDLLKTSLEGANAAAVQARAARDVEAAAAAEAQKAAAAVVEKQAREMERLQSEVARLGAELAERDSKHAGLYDLCAQVLRTRTSAIGEPRTD